MSRLIILTGPTASGKSDLAVRLASYLGCHIVGADSRQLYRDIPIVTAMPSREQLQSVKHHLVGILSLTDYYSAAMYEQQVMQLLPRLWEENSDVVMCGGSMMYIDAVTKGIDQLPTISAHVREMMQQKLFAEGSGAIREMLKQLDPDYYAQVELANTRRVVHAVEICLEAGKPYSSLLTGKERKRDFDIVEMAINYNRDELFDRINGRVEKMDEQGLEQEARRVYHLRNLNSLNTVGLKEMFAYFDGQMDRPTAMARIAKNTRVYAKKQLLWLKKRPQMHLLDPRGNLLDQALTILKGTTSQNS